MGCSRCHMVSPAPLQRRFQDEPVAAFQPFCVGAAGAALPFITGTIEYGQSFFANGLLFDAGKAIKTPERPVPFALMKANQNCGPLACPRSKKRSTGESPSPSQGVDAENADPAMGAGYMTSPKKQKFLPPPPRPQKKEIAEESREPESHSSYSEKSDVCHKHASSHGRPAQSQLATLR